MAYKFQLGAARLSGSTTFEEAATFESSLAASSLSASGDVDGHALDIETTADVGGKLSVSGVSDLDGGIDVNASKFTVSTAGAVVADSTISGAAGTFDALAGTSLALQSGGITAAGALAGVSTIAASGLANLDGGIEIDNGGNKFTVSTAGAVVAESSISGAAGTFDALSGTSLALQSGGITAAGAIAGATTVSGSGNAQFGGTLSTSHGKFTVDADGDLSAKSLNARSGGISNAGAIAGATTIAASSNATIEGIVSGAAGTFDALSGTSLALQSGGISAAGAIAGATTISGSGVISGLKLDIEDGADLGGGGLSNAGAIAGATTIAASGLANLNGGIEVDNGGNKFTVSTAGAVVAESSISGAAGTFDALAGTSLALQSGGISAAGAIAGATTISGSGALAVGSIAMAEFTVDSSGNTDVDGTLNVEGVPTFQAGAVFSAGITTANAIAGATTISGSGRIDGLGLRINTNGFVGTATDNDLLALKDGELSVQGNAHAVNLSGSGTLKVGGTVQLDGVADVAADLSADSLYFLDGDGLVKRESFVDFAASLASTAAGMQAGSGQIGVNLGGSGGLKVDSDAIVMDISNLTPVDIDVANDTFAFKDNGDGETRQESIADLVDAIAGAGLAATNGVLRVQGSSVNAVVSGSSLSEGYNYLPLAAATGSAGLLLPSNPSAGDLVVVKAGSGVSNTNFVGVHTGDSNHKIDGTAGPVRIESPFGAVSLVYVASNDWRIV